MTDRWRLLLITHYSLLITSVVVACNPGQYPIDVFKEMHHQPSYRRLEPDRLAPPEGAVASTTGSRPRPREPVAVPGAQALLTYEQAATLTNPVPATADDPERALQALARAARLYRRDCAPCHGPAGRGQSVIAEYFAREGAEPPTDLTSQRVRARTDGELHWIVTHGLGGMPPFGELLTDEERWLLVRYVRSLGG